LFITTLTVPVAPYFLSQDTAMIDANTTGTMTIKSESQGGTVSALSSAAAAMSITQETARSRWERLRRMQRLQQSYPSIPPSAEPTMSGPAASVVQTTAASGSTDPSSGDDTSTPRTMQSAATGSVSATSTSGAAPPSSVTLHHTPSHVEASGAAAATHPSSGSGIPRSVPGTPAQTAAQYARMHQLQTPASVNVSASPYGYPGRGSAGSMVAGREAATTPVGQHTPDGGGVSTPHPPSLNQQSSVTAASEHPPSQLSQQQHAQHARSRSNSSSNRQRSSSGGGGGGGAAVGTSAGAVAASVVAAPTSLVSITDTVKDFMAGCSTIYFRPDELPTYRRTAQQILQQRAIMTQYIRAKKLARLQGWEQQGQWYLDLHHVWSAHVRQVGTLFLCAGSIAVHFQSLVTVLLCHYCTGISSK
jgi:hypothetical protein